MQRTNGSSGKWGGAASQRQAAETAALCKPWKNSCSGGELASAHSCFSTVRTALGKLRIAGLLAQFDVARSFPQFPRPLLLQPTILTSERGTRFGIRKPPNHVPPPHLPDDPNKRTGKKRTVRLPDRSDDQGNTIKRRVTISPNADLKEPIIQDLDFFIAFLEIAQQQRRESSGVLKNPISFRPTQLFKLLGYKSDSAGIRESGPNENKKKGGNYTLLREWMQRMTFTGLISNNAVHLAHEERFKLEH